MENKGALHLFLREGLFWTKVHWRKMRAPSGGSLSLPGCRQGQLAVAAARGILLSSRWTLQVRQNSFDPSSRRSSSQNVQFRYLLFLRCSLFQDRISLLVLTFDRLHCGPNQYDGSFIFTFLRNFTGPVCPSQRDPIHEAFHAPLLV